jgi:hypothetical protein
VPDVRGHRIFWQWAVRRVLRVLSRNRRDHRRERYTSQPKAKACRPGTTENAAPGESFRRRFSSVLRLRVMETYRTLSCSPGSAAWCCGKSGTYSRSTTRLVTTFSTERFGCSDQVFVVVIRIAAGSDASCRIPTRLPASCCSPLGRNKGQPAAESWPRLLISSG